jgi:hypothetical protein
VTWLLPELDVGVELGELRPELLDEELPELLEDELLDDPLDADDVPELADLPEVPELDVA